MSQEGYDELVAELQHMVNVELPAVRDAIAEARDKGDLSENFEYHAAKKVKNQNEGRIRYLERMIKTAVVIEDESAEDEIGINDTVDILVIEDNSLETYKLVTTVRGDSLNGLISVESPMGKALLSHKVGDTVSIKVNENFSYDVIVKRIEKSDDENDKMRNY